MLGHAKENSSEKGRPPSQILVSPPSNMLPCIILFVNPDKCFGNHSADVGLGCQGHLPTSEGVVNWL